MARVALENGYGAPEGVLELPITLPVLPVSVGSRHTDRDAELRRGRDDRLADLRSRDRSRIPIAASTQRPDQPQDGPGAARGQSVV
jgi:hypothetical protein